jgi:hypothetical protein
VRNIRKYVVKIGTGDGLFHWNWPMDEHGRDGAMVGPTRKSSFWGREKKLEQEREQMKKTSSLQGP